MKPDAALANKVIEAILELSADAQIHRREAAQDSPAFHNLTGAIAAYGKVLELLTMLLHQQGFDPIVAQRELSESVAAVN